MVRRWSGRVGFGSKLTYERGERGWVYRIAALNTELQEVRVRWKIVGDLGRGDGQSRTLLCERRGQGNMTESGSGLGA